MAHFTQTAPNSPHHSPNPPLIHANPATILILSSLHTPTLVTNHFEEACRLASVVKIPSDGHMTCQLVTVNPRDNGNSPSIISTRSPISPPTSHAFIAHSSPLASPRPHLFKTASPPPPTSSLSLSQRTISVNTCIISATSPNQEYKQLGRSEAAGDCGECQCHIDPSSPGLSPYQPALLRLKAVKRDPTMSSCKAPDCAAASRRPQPQPRDEIYGVKTTPIITTRPSPALLPILPIRPSPNSAPHTDSLVSNQHLVPTTTTTANERNDWNSKPSPLLASSTPAGPLSPYSSSSYRALYSPSSAGHQKSTSLRCYELAFTPHSHPFQLSSSSPSISPNTTRRPLTTTRRGSTTLSVTTGVTRMAMGLGHYSVLPTSGPIATATISLLPTDHDGSTDDLFPRSSFQLSSPPGSPRVPTQLLVSPSFLQFSTRLNAHPHHHPHPYSQSQPASPYATLNSTPAHPSTPPPRLSIVLIDSASSLSIFEAYHTLMALLLPSPHDHDRQPTNTHTPNCLTPSGQCRQVPSISSPGAFSPYNHQQQGARGPLKTPRATPHTIDPAQNRVVVLCYSTAPQLPNPPRSNTTTINSGHSNVISNSCGGNNTSHGNIASHLPSQHPLSMPMSTSAIARPVYSMNQSQPTLPTPVAAPPRVGGSSLPSASAPHSIPSLHNLHRKCPDDDAPLTQHTTQPLVTSSSSSTLYSTTPSPTPTPAPVPTPINMSLTAPQKSLPSSNTRIHMTTSPDERMQLLLQASLLSNPNPQASLTVADLTICSPSSNEGYLTTTEMSPASLLQCRTTQPPHHQHHDFELTTTAGTSGLRSPLTLTTATTATTAASPTAPLGSHHSSSSSIVLSSPGLHPRSSGTSLRSLRSLNNKHAQSPLSSPTSPHPAPTQHQHQQHGLHNHHSKTPPPPHHSAAYDAVISGTNANLGASAILSTSSLPPPNPLHITAQISNDLYSLVGPRVSGITVPCYTVDLSVPSALHQLAEVIMTELAALQNDNAMSVD